MPQTLPPKPYSPKIGIWAQFDGVSHVPGSVISPTSSRWENGDLYHVTLRVEQEDKAASRSQSGRFISNPEIRAAIAAGKGTPGMELGSFNLSRVDTRTIKWVSYFPFEKIPKSARSAFTHQGIAQLLEYHALAHLQKKFPEIKRVQHDRASWVLRDTISTNRIGQIRARGTGFSYSLQHVLDMLRWKIGRDTLLHRGKELIATPRGKTAMQRVEARDPHTWKGKMRLRVKRMRNAIRKKIPSENARSNLFEIFFKKGIIFLVSG